MSDQVLIDRYYNEECNAGWSEVEFDFTPWIHKDSKMNRLVIWADGKQTPMCESCAEDLLYKWEDPHPISNILHWCSVLQRYI